MQRRATRSEQACSADARIATTAAAACADGQGCALARTRAEDAPLQPARRRSARQSRPRAPRCAAAPAAGFPATRGWVSVCVTRATAKATTERQSGIARANAEERAAAMPLLAAWAAASSGCACGAGRAAWLASGRARAAKRQTLKARKTPRVGSAPRAAAPPPRRPRARARAPPPCAAPWLPWRPAPARRARVSGHQDTFGHGSLA